MTKTRQILTMMADGKPLTAEQIAESMGLSVSKAKDFIRDLRYAGYLESVPETFTITPQGAKWQKHETKTPREELTKKYARRAAKKRQRADWESSGEGRETLLLTRSVPTSVFQLGAM